VGRVDPAEFCEALSSGNGDLLLVVAGSSIDLPSLLAADDTATSKIRFIMSSKMFTLWGSERFSLWSCLDLTSWRGLLGVIVRSASPVPIIC
jgi:hypothetical protein